MTKKTLVVFGKAVKIGKSKFKAAYIESNSEPFDLSDILGTDKAEITTIEPLSDSMDFKQTQAYVGRSKLFNCSENEVFDGSLKK